MSNLQKFNTTLDDFNTEVGKLKEVSEAYQKLKILTVSYKEISEQFKANSKELAEINELYKVYQSYLSKVLSDLLNANKQGAIELAKLFDKKIEELQRDNKEFYKDLDSTVKIKLDDNKSQIKQLIENERTRIKDIFEIEFAKNTKELKQLIENEFNKQTSQFLNSQKTIKNIIFVLGGISIIIGIIIIAKLFLR